MSLSALRFDLISLIAEYAALNPHPLPRWACDPNSSDLVSTVQRVNFQSSACGRGGAVTGLCVLEEEHGGLTAFYKSFNQSMFSLTRHPYIYRIRIPELF